MRNGILWLVTSLQLADTPPGIAQDVALVPGAITEVASGLDMPRSLAFLPDGSAFVSERFSGRVPHVPPGGGEPREVGVVPDVETSAKGGLLGFAASPDVTRDRLLFAYHWARPIDRVAALRVAEDLGSLALPHTVVEGIGTANRHHGGGLRFGPDGTLWIGTGDAFGPPCAQDRQSLNGKVLRVAPDGSIPADNPFGTAVHSHGHRNIQGLAFGPDEPFVNGAAINAKGVEAGDRTGPAARVVPWREDASADPRRGGRYPEPEGIRALRLAASSEARNGFVRRGRSGETPSTSA